MQSKYVRYGKLYRGSFCFVYENWLYVIVYDKYRHCIEMLLIRQNVAYKWRLQRYPYVAYTIAYRDSLYAMFWHISSISMQCLYLSYTITYNQFSYTK
jgi:hypothetical protein